MNDREQLASLVAGDSTTTPYAHKDMYWGGSMVWYICIFFFIFIIVLLIIFAVEPVCICGEKDQKDDEDCPTVGWNLLYAFFISLFILIIIWLLYAISSYNQSTC